MLNMNVNAGGDTEKSRNNRLLTGMILLMCESFFKVQIFQTHP